MKHILASLFDIAKAAILVSMFALGATIASAQFSTPLVPTSSWVTPPALPPANNASAPINVSINAQRKSGSLLLGTVANPQPSFIALDVLGLASTTSFVSDYLLVSKAVTFVADSPMKMLTFGPSGLTLADGTQGAGKVLTSDASGRATWQAPATACTTTDVPLGTYSINLNSGNNNHVYQLLVGDLEAGTYKLRGNGTWSSVGGGGALGILYNTTQTSTAPPGAPAAATSVGTPEVYLYNVGNFVNYVQHYGADSGTWTAGNGSNDNTFTLTQTQNLYASAGQSAMSGSVSLYRVVSSCEASTPAAPAPIAGSCDAAPVRTITQSNSGTEYQNTTGAQLMVVATASETTFSGQNALAGYIGATSASALASQEIFTSTNRNSITFLVPPGYYYKVVNGATNSPTLNAQVWKLCGSSTSSGATGGGAIADSGNLTIPSADGTSVTWSHGLGQKPGFVRLVLVSLVDQTAAQGSYLAGEELDVSNSVAVPSGGNYVSIPTLVTSTQIILPHQWSSYPLHISANRVGAYNTGIAINRSTWAIKIYAGTSVGSSSGTAGATATAGVSSIVAGTGVTISPANGTGAVTINASGAQGNVCGAAVRKGTMTQFNTVSLSTDSWGCAVDPSGSGFNGGADSNDSYRRTLLNNGTCTNSRKVVVDAIERSFICVKDGNIADSPGGWCGSYNYTRTGANPRLITSANIVCKDSAIACPSGYSEFPYVSQGVGTPANPETGKLTCVKN